jgi:hypothetical protein
MRTLTRKQRCVVTALEHALEHDQNREVDVADRLELTERLPLVPGRENDQPTPPGDDDPTGFAPGGAIVQMARQCGSGATGHRAEGPTPPSAATSLDDAASTNGKRGPEPPESAGPAHGRLQRARRVRGYAQAMLAIGDAIAALPYDTDGRGRRLEERLSECRSDALEMMYETIANAKAQSGHTHVHTAKMHPVDDALAEGIERAHRGPKGVTRHRRSTSSGPGLP